MLPAHRVTPAIAESVIREVAAERGLKLGPIVDAFDARIQGIVDNWPQVGRRRPCRRHWDATAPGSEGDRRADTSKGFRATLMSDWIVQTRRAPTRAR